MGAVVSQRPSVPGLSVMTALKVLIATALVAAVVQSASLNTKELKEAMQEAEDTDSALDWMHHQLNKWSPDAKKIMKKIPPLELKDDGIDLQGARDLMGSAVKLKTLANSHELQLLAKAENRLAAAKQDVHNAQTAKSDVKRAKLEDLAEELTEEAVKRLEETKDMD